MRCHSYFSIILFLFLMNFSSVVSEYRWYTCNSASNYTEGSTYSSNLNHVITDLFLNTPKSLGFNTSSRGQTPNKVYGLLQCIINLSAEKCSECSRAANETLDVYCGNNIGGRVWMDYCFLRYDNFNFISMLNTDTTLLANVKEVTSNTQTFKSTTSSLLSNLSDKAYNPANKFFAVGSANYSSPDTLYGLVQCLRDLSIKNCRECLFTARQELERCCSTQQGAQALLGSCTVRYEIYPFFYSAEPSSPPPTISPSSTPPSPEAPSPANETDMTLVFNTKEVTSNTKIYKSTTSSLLSNLTDKAYNPANKLFAVGSANYSSSDRVYGLVRCCRHLSIKDCKQCLVTARQQLENCCSVKQSAQALSRSCEVTYQIYPILDSAEPSSPPPTTSPYSTSPSPEAHSPANATSKTKSNEKSSRRLPIILGIIGGVTLTLVCCSLAMRSKVRSAVSSKSATRVQQNEDAPEIKLFKNKQVAFSLKTLIEATGDFNDNNKIGEGGFGPVYKGMTRDGKEIAVKKLSAKSAQGKREFMNEVELVANIQHRNLVSLLGCCAEGTERLLVYEYLPNKSLDTILFVPEKRRRLVWQKRYDIIMGISRGLLYLHEDSKLRIIHRDIKANNILLDERLNPKIADFGLARLFPDSETEIQSKVAGTYGYMAPEYAMGGQLSVKADIYSFGVLILEIVSGRKNTDINFLGEKKIFSVLEWAWRLYKGGHVVNIVDSVLVGNYPEEQAIRCIHVGLLCTQADPELRPLISNVVTMISSDSVPLPDPSRPAFVSMTSCSPNISINPTVSSRNETSISNLEPR